MKATIFLTNRMSRILHNTENIALESNDKFIKPIHLFLSCLKEKGGAIGELRLHLNLDVNAFTTKEKLQNYQTVNSEYFTMPVSEEVVMVMEKAIAYMGRYNQIYINEGHLLRALIVTNELDDYLTEEQKQIVLTIGTTARDMITHLGKYQFPDLDSHQIRKATVADEDTLVAFVEQHFSPEWAEAIKGAFSLPEPPVYISLDNDKNIIGFAAYDLYQGKKGYFGPMGMITSKRAKGIGYALLHHCLRDMKEIGYEYAVIGGAGPLEFYERACNAVVIPLPYTEFWGKQYGNDTVNEKR